MKILFTCDGTGGHMYPLIALYNEMKERSECASNEYLFVGSDYKNAQDENIYNHEGITSYKQIKSRGIKRQLTFANLKGTFCNLYAFLQASSIINKFKPDLVIGSGGYPSFHMIYTAKHKHIPYILLESNILPGLVIRLMYKDALLVILNSAITMDYLTPADNLKVLGSPSKKNNSNSSKEDILKQYKITDFDKKVVVVMGGSCGSPKINEAMIGIINNGLLDNYNIILSTGMKDYNLVISQLYNEHKHSIVEYVDNIPELLSVSDLVVARVGAMSILDIKASMLPSVLVPMSDSTNNHQYINAKELEDQGVAQIITEDRLDSSILSSTISDYLCNDERISLVRDAYMNLPSQEDCTKNICDNILYSI